jgi:hypothetical protein
VKAPAGMGRRRVQKRWWFLAVLLLVLVSACKKSEGSKVENLFGASPKVSEVSVTKERINRVCDAIIDNGCGRDCSVDVRLHAEVSEDFLTATARVTDATPPTGSNTSDILVVVLRFLVPPPSLNTSGGTPYQYSLEMFDNGPVALVTQATATDPQVQVPVVSGDLVANDGIYTRKVYFGTTQDASTCLLQEDYNNYQHGYSEFRASLDIEQDSVSFGFTIQAIDRSGNIATSSEIAVPIQGTFRQANYDFTACGAPKPGGGCYSVP